jgi:hypothetical protein
MQRFLNYAKLQSKLIGVKKGKYKKKRILFGINAS